MNKRKLYLGILLGVIIMALGVVMGLWVKESLAEQKSGEVQVASPDFSDESLAMVQEPTGGEDPLILSYAAKFVCLEPLQPGTVFYGPVAPIVQEHTDVLVHNPHDIPVTFYKKAVRAPLQGSPPIPPGNWQSHLLEPDFAVREDCDGITKLLTGDPTATFIGTFGIGVKVEGFVVIGVGPQVGAGGNVRYAPLDVTAEYSRSSEVLKKDISYQPWWWWWWWPLPWNLGYAYDRKLPVSPGANIDCRRTLYAALHQDVDATIPPGPQNTLTHQALEAGANMDPRNILQQPPDPPPALVAMIGRCDNLDPTTAAIAYVLLSNKGMTDPDPSNPAPNEPTGIVPYPWFPGHWYDLAVVVPQNYDMDIDNYFHTWQSDRWIAAGGDPATVQAAMVYYFPWWCGWGYWWWWWNNDDCVDIGVGEGESLDVEQITPVRVFMLQWPPIP
ncbi:MAG: hypothetical protein L0332_28060 [Chloroflexi bacterium]|nr:hypothetical protein [Chloroflexota bacterium]MCI0574780.1 hypothetical protein [Chloroflexota bacterium]MCI0648855.1 hypothetical protein [Chloroflexota bacterium]MCI0730555.1 hypothetical protein [Chloroflexota bacterium]